MINMTYTMLLNSTLNLYMKGDFLKAYEFITANAAGVKGNEAQILNFRYSIASRAGLVDVAMDIMKEAINNKGYWYSYNYLTEDDDLRPLHKYREFYELADICREREIEAKRNSKPDIKIIKPDNIMDNKKYPLLIALHGNEENVYMTEDYWSTCIRDNYILALPQSSQIGFSMGYYWNDLNKSSDELRQLYVNILNDYNIDMDNVIIAGFSAGARAALHSVLNDNIKVKGFILVGPWLPEIDEWENLIDKLKSSGIKGYIICGDKDEDCLEGAEKFADMLNGRNIPNIFKIVKDLGHDYPSNFNEELKTGIGFIMS